MFFSGSVWLLRNVDGDDDDTLSFKCTYKVLNIWKYIATKKAYMWNCVRVCNELCFVSEDLIFLMVLMILGTWNTKPITSKHKKSVQHGLGIEF